MAAVDRIDPEPLARWLAGQRWFASKSREVVAPRVLEAAELPGDREPRMVLALVEVAFGAGTHVLYHLPLGLRHAGEGWTEGAILTAGGRTVYDALVDPVLARRLVAALREERRMGDGGAQWLFHAAAEELPSDAGLEPVRPVRGEQTNSSTVFGEALVLKVYRRIEPGPNPELELLRFLTAHGFEHVAGLRGWCEHAGRLVDATLGIAQEYVPSRGDGWNVVLAGLAGDGGEAVLAQLAALGEVTARMHTTLGSDPIDPTFAPEEPSAEALSLLLATVDEDIEEIFRDLRDVEEAAPIAGHGQDVRDRLRGFARAGATGRLIRTHGDFHLGQLLLTGRGWVVLDFEGEPARSLPERRQKRSPLRDVAGMLRSFAYAASATWLQRGVAAPADWEERARRAFLDRYLETVDHRLLPGSRQSTDRLLSIFELEKAVYELRYELDNRPDWVRVPVAGILRLLEAEPP